jgi:hypothetical protein
VVGNLAVGRFHGVSGYSMAYATADGHLRVVDEPGKGGGAIDVSWRISSGGGAPDFAPSLIGLDLDRQSNGELELLVVDSPRGMAHAYDLTGAELPGWPVTVPGRLSAPAAGDLDGDGYPEVVAVDESGTVHRWNRNGIEPLGWPVQLAARYRNGAGTGGGHGSPVVADLDGDGRQDVLVALTNGLLVALDGAGKTLAGWPLGMERSTDVTPLVTSLNGSDYPPDPAGAAWLHVVGVGDGGQWDVLQAGSRADSAFFAADGTSPRSPWIGLNGNRRRSAILDDTELKVPVTTEALFAKGSFYCFPNPSHGSEVGIAYTLDPGITSVEIRVLDPSGAILRTLAGGTAPAQNVTRIPLQDLASGVYLVRIEAKRGGATEVAFQKFAVVR